MSDMSPRYTFDEEVIQFQKSIMGKSIRHLVQHFVNGLSLQQMSNALIFHGYRLDRRTRDIVESKTDEDKRLCLESNYWSVDAHFLYQQIQRAIEFDGFSDRDVFDAFMTFCMSICIYIVQSDYARTIARVSVPSSLPGIFTYWPILVVGIIIGYLCK